MIFSFIFNVLSWITLLYCLLEIVVVLMSISVPPAYFFHFDYFCFLVNLHHSDQSNPRGNVTIFLFRFIHSISVTFFFSSGGSFVSILSNVASKVCFSSSCGYPWNGFTESVDQTTFHSLSWGCTAHLQWDLFSGCVLLSFGLLSKRPQPADEKQSNFSSERSI